MSNNRYCVVIPIYNHHHKLQALLSDLKTSCLPVLLIDDGSCQISADKIVAIVSEFEFVKLKTLQKTSARVVR